MPMDEGEIMKEIADSNKIINESKTKSRRIASIILGVFSIIVPIGIVGICVGNSEKRKTGRTLGRDLSMLGTVIGTALLCAFGTVITLEFFTTDICKGSELQVKSSRLEWQVIEMEPYIESLISRDHTIYLNLDTDSQWWNDTVLEVSDSNQSFPDEMQDNYDLFLVSYFNFLGQEQILESASDLMPVEGNSDLYYAYVDLTEESDGKTNGTLQYFLLSVSKDASWTFQVSLYDTEKSITEVDALVEDVLSTMTIKAE